jgi:hypothetical protein
MRSRRATICSFLMAPLLLGVSLAPPPLRHLHDGGSRPHSHQQASHAPHHHGHRHAHRHSHETASIEPQAHLHLSWLFIDWSFPVQSPGDSDPSERGTQLPPAVTAKASAPATHAVDDGSRWLDLSLFGAGHELAPTFEVLRSPSFGDALRPAGGLLCDTARRERSGVLLI